ncbi:MAG: AraC-like DNA-binding protein [Flammeovirgaceae bacterium]|jgi:AraC-like DNA-binding protein
MEDYNKIIESLIIRFVRSNALDAFKPVHIKNYYDFQSTLVLLDRGDMQFGLPEVSLKPGNILFLPGGKNTAVSFGKGEMPNINNEQFVNNKEQYLRYSDQSASTQDVVTRYLSVTFDAKAFDSVNFFSTLDIPPFVIENSPLLESLIRKISRELHSIRVAKIRLLNIYTEELVIETFRHILDNQMFVEQLATNNNYFKDERLLDIFGYIKNNLNGDLSNKTLSAIASVSEDYVGQYFKMLTGINPQDYIEYQRMETAVNLLRTTNMSIRKIGHEVGYKDTAYFCRRFKMMFGIPAGKMRKRESMMEM